ncbi:MAG: PKD domain-containing protein [Candidatus Bathyarchaeia archaeon]
MRSGGYTPYSYQWYLDGIPISGATSDTWNFTPTESGIFYIQLKVTDANGNTAQSETARVTAITVPVGGYSIPIITETNTEPTMLYITLITILTITFAVVRRKEPKNKQ